MYNVILVITIMNINIRKCLKKCGGRYPTVHSDYLSIGRGLEVTVTYTKFSPFIKLAFSHVLILKSDKRVTVHFLKNLSTVQFSLILKGSEFKPCLYN